jgi:hypothetical protein
VASTPGGGPGKEPGPFDEEMNSLLDVSPLKMASMQLHEMYRNLRESGFNRKEALYLVAQMMRGEPE